MKIKRVTIAISITALIVTVLLIWLRAYYVVIAFIAGTLLIGHREFWSLIRKRKLAPIGERVRENTSRSIRNGFIFLVIALIFLMLPFSVLLIEAPNTVHVLGGLLISAGTVYLLSYLFYDRVQPTLGEGGLRILKIFLLVAGISLGTFIISVVLHNVIYGLLILWFGEDFWDRIGVGDEPVFFIMATIVCPIGFLVGAVGTIVLAIKKYRMAKRPPSPQ